MPEAGSWDWWGGLGDAITGGGRDSSRADRERKVATYRQYFLSGRGDLMREWERKHPRLAKEIKAGKYAYLFPESIARPAAPPAQPKPTRLGDLPLRPTRDAILPAIGGPLRKIATGGLRILGPASWLATAATIGPWMSRPGTVAPYKGGFTPSAPRPKDPSTLPPGARKYDRPGLPAAPPPAGLNRGVARPEIKPVVVTAKRKPVSSGTITSAAPVPAWKAALGALLANPTALINALLPKREPSQRHRTEVIVGPFTLPPAREDPIPSPEPLTPLEPGGVGCACPPKKPRKPRKPRDECRSGRFIERLSGIQKYQTRKVPCRASNARLS